MIADALPKELRPLVEGFIEQSADHLDKRTVTFGPEDREDLLSAWSAFALHGWLLLSGRSLAETCDFHGFQQH